MLAFTIKYQLAIDSVTVDKSANLRKFKLDKDEWIIAGQLHSTLKVCAFLFLGLMLHVLITT
jgi:hypothetical protein